MLFIDSLFLKTSADLRSFCAAFPVPAFLVPGFCAMPAAPAAITAALQRFSVFLIAHHTAYHKCDCSSQQCAYDQITHQHRSFPDFSIKGFFCYIKPSCLWSDKTPYPHPAFDIRPDEKRTVFVSLLGLTSKYTRPAVRTNAATVQTLNIPSKISMPIR